MNTKISVEINPTDEDQVLALAEFFRLTSENLKVAQADPTQDISWIIENCEVRPFSEEEFDFMYSTISDYGSGPVGMPDHHAFTPVIMVFWESGEQGAIGFRTAAAEKEFELNM